MIAYLRGRLGQTWNTTCTIITASGVGYAVCVPGHTFADLPPAGAELELFISAVVREDAIELFGFSTFDERQAFEMIRGVSRVGSKTALAILTTFRPDDLRRIVLDDDLGSLTRVSGIGKKTAQHLLLELKYKFRGSHPGRPEISRKEKDAPLYGDVLAALSNLGYEEEECAPLVRNILREDPDLDESETLRAALKKLAQGKA